METRAAKRNKRRQVDDNGEATAKKIKVEITDGENDGNVTASSSQMVDCEEVNQTLRHAVSNWLKRYTKVTRLNAELCVRDLVHLQSMGNGEWRKNVLSLREVQKRITWVVEAMREITDRKKRDTISSTLRQILSPDDNITPSIFPNIRAVTESIDSKSCSVDPCKLKKIRHLIDMLQESLDSIPDKAEKLTSHLRQAQRKLEATIRAYSQGVDNIYHYLVCVGVLRLFGFKVNGFFFEHDLRKNDFDHMVEMLERHLGVFNTLQGKTLPQAYLFGLVLCCPQDLGNSIEFVINKLPEELCPELKEICEHGRDMCCLEEIRNKITKLLPDGKQHLKVNWKSLLLCLKNQLRFIIGHNQNTDREIKVIRGPLSDSVESMLFLLNIRKYYPQKLALEDVIKLTPDVLVNENAKPKTLPELPWYFMKHIIALDSETRENCHVPRNENDNSDDDDETMTNIHPLDLVYSIFLCADDFLRQELADKMVKCQYAVPFILPPEEKNIKSKNLILHWALRSINRTFCNNENVVNQTLINVETPVVVFMHTGTETTWKGKIMNKLLSPQQATFWHKGLKGGDCSQLSSGGMVEVAWYLPGRQQNTFSHPVTFLNLRKEVEPSDVVCEKLYEFSSLCCLFAAQINYELEEFLRNKIVMSKVVLVILHREGEDKEVSKACKELAATFGLQKHQIIRKTADDVNFNAVFNQLQNQIEQCAGRYSLSAFASTVGSGMEVDDKKCYFAKMAAASILMDKDAFYAKDPTSVESAILPCQSDIKLREKISQLDKELCQQRRHDENTRVQEYALAIKEQKWQFQLSQLQIPISETFKYFLNCLQSFYPLQRKYFLQYLKFGLDERSDQRRRRVREGTDTDGKLREIDERITHGSLSIEHFFREMAVLYENMVALKQKSGSHELNEVLTALAKSRALTFKEGTAIEIMDGDALHVPVEWLKAVLTSIEDQCRSTLFKVSVLGAQGCGKSTLLNTVFGLNVPVKNRERCTRGTYLHLLKLDESLEKELHCSYVAVIDSAGLVCRSKADSSDYDIELSTFVMGVSDLTLFIKKDEGSEVLGVLSLTIHMLLRMNIVGEHKECKFIHQNMGEVDTVTKIAREVDAFVGELNEKTLTAAKDADQSDRYKKFTDVLHYDPGKDDTYVPGLWTGAPPMGRASYDYSKTLQKLKTEIIRSIANSVVFKHRKFCTFLQLSNRLSELWQAINCENFVLFKNVLAVEAHKKLTKVFSDEQLAVKRGIDDMTKQEKQFIENEIKMNHSNKPVKQLVESSINEIHNNIIVKVGAIEEKILHYFRCGGCSNCSSSVTNRHLLVNNEKEFRDEIQSLKRTLIKELNSSMGKFEKQMTTEKQIHELSIEMDTKLKRKVNEAIRSEKSTDLSKVELEQIFDKLWDEATGDILQSDKEVYQEEDIQAMVQMTIRSLLGSEDHLYMQSLTGSKKGIARNKPGKVTFKVVPIKHMKLILRRWDDCFAKITDNDVQRLQKMTDSIISDTRKHYQNNSPGGTQFHQMYVEELFVGVLDQIKNIKDERFKTAFMYKVDVLHCVETMAVEGFTKMHNNYVKQKSSREAILAEKKESYRDMFILNMGYDNVAVSFCNNILNEIILRNVDEALGCVDLLQELKSNLSEIFCDIKSVQAAVMVEMFWERKFIKYIEYIANYEASVKRKIDKECVQYFVRDKKYKELGQKVLERVANNILQAIDSTMESNCSTKTFMRTFFSNIEYLKIHPNEISAYLDQDVLDKKQFKEKVHQQLNGRLRDAIRKRINSWNVEAKLKRMKLTDFLFTELGGCNSTCPFCAVPCDAHSGGRTMGNHSASLHRPVALYGYTWADTGKFMTGDCRSNVALDHVFLHGNPEIRTAYKKYQTVYPDWTIQPETDPDVEKYWQWVFAEYSKEFSKYYSIPEAILPLGWGKYERDDIIKDIEDHYNIRVNRSTQ